MFFGFHKIIKDDIGASPSGKAAGFGPAIRRFESFRPSISKRRCLGIFFFYLCFNDLLVGNKTKSVGHTCPTIQVFGR